MLVSSSDEVKKVTDELLLASRLKYEKKVKEYLNFPPLKENTSLEDFPNYCCITRICKPRYSVLLKTLLDKKIISPNTSFSFNGIILNLLSEAICYSIYFSQDSLPENRLNAVRVLLNAGAHANKACMPHKYLPKSPQLWDKNCKNSAETPLSKAITMNDVELASLLLQYHCKVDCMCHEMTPLMKALKRYADHKKAFGMDDATISIYKMIDMLVKSDADINIPCKYQLGSNAICTPMQLARESGCTEIVALFEEHQRGEK